MKTKNLFLNLLDVPTSNVYIILYKGEYMIIEAIAKAIKKSGKTRYQISKETGVDQAVLCRLLQGGSCSLETADKLCKYLGLELKPQKRRI